MYATFNLLLFGAGLKSRQERDQEKSKLQVYFQDPQWSEGQTGTGEIRMVSEYTGQLELVCYDFTPVKLTTWA